MPGNIDVNEQTALLIDSHLCLDAAISDQLKDVISDTEHAAMMLIRESRKLSDAANVVEAMLSQTDRCEDMRQYYEVMIEHNTQLAAGIAEILGHTQFQDGVRQRIERIETAIAKRNVLFLAFAKSMVGPDPGLPELPLQMHAVLEEYLAIESRHAHTVASGQDEGLIKFELF
jgi:hypothetical protein